MNLKAFLVAALGDALERAIATPDDVLRHVTPEVLATHLPRPLWARLITACLGAPRVDAQLVVETIGVPNLVEHVPLAITWACLREVAMRALGVDAPPLPITAPPPATGASTGPAVPPPGTTATIADIAAALEADERPAPTSSRTRSGTSPRFRQGGTGIGRFTNARRPQASASASASAAAPAPAPDPAARRGGPDSDEPLESEVSKDDWKNAIAVEDEQLVDWSSADETVTHGERDDGFGKR